MQLLCAGVGEQNWSIIDHIKNLLGVSDPSSNLDLTGKIDSYFYYFLIFIQKVNT
jgi:hypothetical protein